MTTPTTKPKRRWHLRWSVRAMFLGVTVVCVWFGLVSRRAQEQKRAVEELRAAVSHRNKAEGYARPYEGHEWLVGSGVNIVYDYEVHSGLYGITQQLPEAEISPPGPDWLRDLIGVDYFADVVAVKLYGTKIRDDDLTKLQYFSALEALELDVCWSLTDVGLEHLKSLKNLKVLAVDFKTEAELSDLQRALPNCQIKVEEYVQLWVFPFPGNPSSKSSPAAPQ